MSSSGTIVLGVDPGINHTGFGIIAQEGNRFRYLDSGAIHTSTRQKFPQRLEKIHQELEGLITRWQPEVMSLEESIYAQNVRVALKLGQARGVVVLAAARHGMEFSEFSPKKIKLSVVGNGAASKEQVRFMVTRLLDLPQEPASFDEADALAAAICYLNQNKMQW